MNVNLVGKGWFQEPRSLDTSLFPEKNAWHSWWNETTISFVQQSISDPNALTVLLTGRQYSPFHEKIKSMLLSRKLFFDVISLKPDDSKIQWELMYRQPQLSEKFKGKVTDIPANYTTIIYKKALIQGLVKHHPSVREISIWEDRQRHVRYFKRFLDDFIEQGIIEQGTIHVVRCKEKYLDEQSEIELVNSMIEENFIEYEDIIVEDNIIRENNIKENSAIEDTNVNNDDHNSIVFT
ncbi:2070_t:CDS:1 [Ambispora gerdemannii]|uniref:2070_t:CDS:1 n=1 Tax=Ambispora gerdemannii TaxID=144530 RepID=A0A9N8WDA0_9GLOM|nr:2070_t:CDS:1 [Ambispora gerdemannii]